MAEVAVIRALTLVSHWDILVGYLTLIFVMGWRGIVVATCLLLSQEVA